MFQGSNSLQQLQTVAAALTTWSALCTGPSLASAKGAGAVPARVHLQERQKPGLGQVLCQVSGKASSSLLELDLGADSMQLERAIDALADLHAL